MNKGRSHGGVKNRPSKGTKTGQREYRRIGGQLTGFVNRYNGASTGNMLSKN